MTALQIIDEIKTMMPQERKEVARFLSQYNTEQPVRYADDIIVKEASKRLLKRHAALMIKLAN